MAEMHEPEPHEVIDVSAPSDPSDVKTVGRITKSTRFSTRARWAFIGGAVFLIFVLTYGFVTIFSTKPATVVETTPPPLTREGKASAITTSPIDKIVADAPQGLDTANTARPLPPIPGQPSNQNSAQSGKSKDLGQNDLSSALDATAKGDKSTDALGAANSNGSNLSNGAGNTTTNAVDPADKTSFDVSGPSVPNPGPGGAVGNTGTAISPVIAAGTQSDFAKGKQDHGNSSLYVGEQNQGQGQSQSALTNPTPGQQSPQANSLLSGAQQTPSPTQPRVGGGGGISSAIEFANGQGEKPAYLTGTQLSPIGKYELWAGSIIPAILDTGINSNLPGPVIGHVLNDVYDSKTGQTLLIPKGSRLIGRYNTNVTTGVPRIQVVWDRLIWTDGKFISLDGQVASEPEGQSGLYADVNDHRGRVITASIFTALIASGAQILSNSNGGGSSSTQTNASQPTNGQTIQQNVGGAIADTGSNYINKQAQIPDELTVPRAKPFHVLLDRTIVLPAWHYE